MTATTEPAAPGATPAPTLAAAVTLTEASFIALVKAAGATVASDAKTAASDVAHGSIAGAASEVGAAGKAVVADVKALPWGHIVTFLASFAATIGAHVFKLFGL